MAVDAAVDEKKAALAAYLEEICGKPRADSWLIAVLHKAQEIYGFVPREAMDQIAQRMQIPAAHIWGVATFYHYFNLKPRGRHVISVCMGTACYVKGAGEILDALREALKIRIGETTDDGLFTLMEARCLGACGLAPVMMIDDKIYGELTPKKTADIIAQYRKKAG